MDKAQALHSFWSSFGLEAYDEGTVPEDATMPYITYAVTTDSMDYIVGFTASLWYRSKSWKDVTEKSQEISEYIGNTGFTIPLDRGYLYIYRGTPFAQRMSDPDDMVRRIYINANGEFLTDR